MTVPASPILNEKAPLIVATKTPHPRMRDSTDYAHKPRLIILTWLVISIPLVAWDTLYVLLRPHTMPGGKLHSLLWEPYALYGAIDHIYGWPAWNSHNGFTAAQSVMNIPESACYCWYLYVVGPQIVNWSDMGIGDLEVKVNSVSLAVLLCFSAAVMTVSKTLLYCESPFLEHCKEWIS